MVEFAPAGEPPVSFAGYTAPLVYFLSFAFATRYGAQHELSKAAALLRDKHKIDLKPLLTFADRAAEDDANRAELERIWQDAAPLAESCRAVTAAIVPTRASKSCWRTSRRCTSASMTSGASPRGQRGRIGACG